MIDFVPLTRNDIVPFADLGTEVRELQVRNTKFGCTLTRNGIELKILVGADMRVTLSRTDSPDQVFRSPAAMLAGSTFGDLKRWSQHQSHVSEKQDTPANPIRVTGTIIKAENETNSRPEIGRGVAELDVYLAECRSGMATNSSLILVVDGPAGSGKTTLVQELAHRRASRWNSNSNPLVLHVESRGRVLQNLRDLLAFSLQTLRVSVTYDQIVPLVRHGLVMLAIDGFDELADPTGYETAWSQLNELIVNTRGWATLVLAGRETFISRARVERALPAYKSVDDQMPLFTLEEVQPTEAKNWLREFGWTDATFSLPVVEPIFETGSYALRPVFLSQFRYLKDDLEKGGQLNSDLLSFLVERMLDREVTKFAESIDNLETEKLRIFLKRLLQEIARDIAENQVNAIPNQSLRWIAEFAASNLFPSDFVNVLVNRAENVAFLTPDSRSEHTKFTHEQISINFLAQECFRSVTDGEIPKYIRRNIFGQEALDGFARAAGSLEVRKAEEFVGACKNQLTALGQADRSKQNLTALAVVVACVAELSNNEMIIFDNADLGEILIPADAAPIGFSNATIATLYARSVDLTDVLWDRTTVVTLFADKFTIVGENLPSPSVVELPGNTLRVPYIIEKWLRPSTLSLSSDTLAIPEEQLELLKRIDRYRPFWLREEIDTDDRSARKILTDQHWEAVRQVLQENHLIEERNIAAAGPSASFIHFRRSIGKFAENENVLFALRKK